MKLHKKDRADWVFYNVTIPNQPIDAIAIRHGTIIAIGNIASVFSNYRGFKDFNAQGNTIGFANNTKLLQVGQPAHGLIVYKNKPQPDQIIWEIVGKNCINKHINLLKEHHH